MNDALERHGPWVLVGAIELTLLALVVPFVAHNNLYGHDLVGHYAAAKFTRDHLFPAVFGWNPLFYCGAAQNQLYPPLLSWLAAGLGRLVEVGLALKLLVAAAVLATPPAFYAFARAVELSRLRAAFAALALTLYLTLNSQELGGNFFSTFVTGNLANAFNLPLLFLYFASLVRLRRPGASLLLPSLLLALNLMSHLVGGLVALVFLASEAGLDSLLPASETGSRPLRYLAHALLGFALSAFFTVPLILRVRFGSPDMGSNNQYPDSLLLQLWLYGVLLAYFLLHRPERRGLGGAAVTTGVLFLAHGVVFNDYLPEAVALHIHRFKLYDSLLALLMMISLVGVAPVRRWAGLARWPWAAPSALAAAGVLALCAAAFGIDTRGVADPALPRLPALDSRVMVISSPLSQVSDHTLQQLVALDGDHPVGKGLFFETAANARALAALELLLARTDRPPRLWNINLDERLESLRPQLARLLRLFGFGYVLSNEGLHAGDGPIRAAPQVDVGGDFTLYSVGPAPLAEVWKGAIDTIEPARFENEAHRWVFTDLDRLVAEVQPGEALPAAPAPPVLQAARVAYAQQGDGEIAVDVAADAPVPVLVKVSWFPFWRAVGLDGRALPLFRVTPHFMLVYGRGPLVLRYQPPVLDRALAAVSLGAWGLVLGLLAAAPIARRRPGARPALLVAALLLAVAGAAGSGATFARPHGPPSAPGIQGTSTD